MTQNRILATTDLKEVRYNFDTDGGDLTVTLPAGVAGQPYRLFNSGSNDVILTPSVNEKIDLQADNATKTFSVGVLLVTYLSVKGWL